MRAPPCGRGRRFAARGARYNGARGGCRRGGNAGPANSGEYTRLRSCRSGRAGNSARSRREAGRGRYPHQQRGDTGVDRAGLGGPVARFRGSPSPRLPRTGRLVPHRHPRHEGKGPRLDRQYLRRRCHRSAADVHRLWRGKDCAGSLQRSARDRGGALWDPSERSSAGRLRLGQTKAVSASEAAAGTAEVTAARGLLDRGDETNAETAARLVTYLTLGAGREITGKLISAVWDRWDTLHRNPAVLEHKDVFTLRRVVPEERNLSLDG